MQIKNKSRLSFGHHHNSETYLMFQTICLVREARIHLISAVEYRQGPLSLAYSFCVV